MSTLTQKNWLLVKQPDPAFQKESFKLAEAKLDVSELQEGQVLVKVIYLSLDPSMRYMVAMVPVGDTMCAFGLGVVIDSKSSRFAKGEFVLGLLGFQEYAILKDDDHSAFLMKSFADPKYPLHIALNNLGVTGLTAYFGVVSKAEAKEGETFVVSGAAGATGLAAGLIAKIKGCRVVGIAGTDRKCHELLHKYKFDAVINYKTTKNIAEDIKKHCPKGIDVYFDNVGGPILDAVLTQIAFKARIVLCGAISQYNVLPRQAYGVKNTNLIVTKEAKMEGLMVGAFFAKFEEAQKEICGWIDQGKMPVLPITLKKGIENAVDALIGLFQGSNVGKSLVQVSAPPSPYKE